MIRRITSSSSSLRSGPPRARSGTERASRATWSMSAEDYPVLVKVRDEFGNVGGLKAVVPVDILVEKIATGFRILSSRIFFKPYTADYTGREAGACRAEHEAPR